MARRVLDHATDLAVEVEAVGLGGAFAEAGMAVAEEALGPGGGGEGGEPRRVSLREADARGLLYSWLDEVIYILVTEAFAISGIEASVSREGGSYSLEASVRGGPLAGRGLRVEPKAPTLHEMRVWEAGGRAGARFLVDL